jgi:tetratricopeptide (TPR) repeat protein
MKRTVIIFRGAILIAAIFCTMAHAQATMEMLRLEYQNFNYRKIIALSDELLAGQNRLQRPDLIELWQLRALAHYSLQDMDQAMADFTELLHIDPSHQLDASRVSPKIIQFFEELKTQVHTEPTEKVVETVRDTIRVYVDHSRPMSVAIGRSLVLPGWGHQYLGAKGKGRILILASMVTGACAVLMTVDCHQKENDYLSNVQSADMDRLYQRYNKAYQSRNLFIGAFVTTYLFTQVDLLLHPPRPPSTTALRIQPHLNADGHPALTASFSF